VRELLNLLAEYDMTSSMGETPRKLGRYELIRRIAVGGMGEIYLARTRGTAGFEKTVIIKTILPHLAEEEEFVEKFLDEGRIVVNLTHGNIVPVFDMDEAGGEYFIAMEYVPGRDLRDVLSRLRDRGETIPPDLAAYIISQVCEGLGYAHQKTDEDGNPLDIVHRDVSPSNVLISTDGEVKIIDFGVARAADRRAKTVSGQIQGKCCYMSPEQAKGESLDYRSDIFSTGVVFYELLTCVRLFDGESDLKSLDLVRECEFDPPSAIEGDVPEELDRVIERALAEEPEDRYDQIDDMKLELMEYLVSRGRAVTSEEVAEFLSDLFPEGLEREAFQEAREEADEPSGPMGLDDALEYQLDQLGDEEVDPLDPTLPEGEAEPPQIGEMGRTETITPESGLREEGDDSTTADDATKPGRPGAKVGDEEREVRARAGEETATEEVQDEQTRWWPWAGVAAALSVVAAVGGYAFVGGADRGTLTIQTDPSGATVEVDGSELSGSKTPRDVELEPGAHFVKLTREGHESETVRVDVEEGEREKIAAALAPADEDETPEPRQFELRTDPPNATLWADQEKLGRAPQTIEVIEGHPTFVQAEKGNCEPEDEPVYYGRPGNIVRIELDCPESTDEETRGDDGGNDRARASSGGTGGRGARPARVELRFVSEPAGASVHIDGESVGTAPVEREFRRGKRIRVRFEKSGFEPVEQEVTAGRVDGDTVRAEFGERRMGCLNFFAVHPQYNEIAIDGKWLEGRRQKLRDYELAAGAHEIRVRNPDAEKDETFSFQIEPGDECTSLTVWDPDDG